jgi:hypothetical protein
LRLRKFKKNFEKKEPSIFFIRKRLPPTIFIAIPENTLEIETSSNSSGSKGESLENDLKCESERGFETVL